MDEVGIEQARRTLGEIVDRARIAEQQTRITRQGKPAAVVVSAKWYDAALEALDYIGRTVDTGRYLGDYEVIHKDGDPRNNDPANLEIREKPDRDSATDA